MTAIRRADEDQNAATDADTTWTPLLTTPTYPAYAGNAACLSAASARALQIAFGRDDIPFTVVYPRTMGLPTETRDYAGSGIGTTGGTEPHPGGIHFKFDNDASQAYCVRVPEVTAATYMRPR